MAWSTRELAELAGTSLRAVRHYHDVGLLEEPAREANGYKRYGARHLVRLLTIRRLVDLGFSLTEVADLEKGTSQAAEVASAVDARLVKSIERLQQARLELSVLLDGPLPDPELPAALRPLAGQPLSAADRAYLVVLSRVVTPQVLESYIEAARTAYAEPVFDAFNALPDDADAATCAALAEEMLPHTERMRVAHPALRDLARGSAVGGDKASGALGVALEEFYNHAQRDVLSRLGAAARSNERGVF